MNPLQPLIEELKKLPGVGEKSAQRMAFSLLGKDKKSVETFAKTMVTTRNAIKYCSECYNISLNNICHICEDPKRDNSLLCIVSSPKDVFAIEKTQEYNGLYHILGGLLSPLDGIHPESLRIKELITKIKERNFSELLFAINPTVEGDTTIMYLNSLLTPFNITITKLAYGLPMGSDIDYADEITLTKAISARRKID